MPSKQKPSTAPPPQTRPPANIATRIARLRALYLSGELKGPAQHEVHPGLPQGSRENYLYFSLPCCLNFQRDSPALWRSALRTYTDPETSYLFFPERVSGADHAKVAADLAKHRLAIQTKKHPDIWLRISKTLHDHYSSDPRAVLASAEYDVQRIVHLLQVEKKHLFPFLGGLKLSNYWLFILSRFTDATFRNPHAMSIIPDTHVIQATIKLGLAEAGAKATEVEEIWRVLLAGTGIPPGDMHSALWRWSRGDFAVEV